MFCVFPKQTKWIRIKPNGFEMLLDNSNTLMQNVLLFEWLGTCLAHFPNSSEFTLLVAPRWVTHHLASFGMNCDNSCIWLEDPMWLKYKSLLDADVSSFPQYNSHRISTEKE